MCVASSTKEFISYKNIKFSAINQMQIMASNSAFNHSLRQFIFNKKTRFSIFHFKTIGHAKANQWTCVIYYSFLPPKHTILVSNPFSALFSANDNKNLIDGCYTVLRSLNVQTKISKSKLKEALNLKQIGDIFYSLKWPATLNSKQQPNDRVAVPKKKFNQKWPHGYNKNDGGWT